MFRSKSKSLIFAVVLVGMLLAGVAETQAGWRHWGYWGGPAYSYYAPYGGWYAGARAWPVRRWAFGPYRWYSTGWGGWGRGYGCYDPCCYSTCCYTPCYSTCCYDPCCGGSVISPSAPSAHPTPTPAPQQSAPAQPLMPEAVGPQTRLTLPDDAGLLTIVVPDAATVFVNGYQTKSTGASRQYVSYGLKPGLSYKYEVRAEMIRDGRLVENAQVVYLTAGNNQRLAFSFEPAPDQRLAKLW